MKEKDFLSHVLEVCSEDEFLIDTVKSALLEFSKQSGAGAASVWLLDADETIRLYAAYGEKCEGLETVVLRKGQGICGTCIQNNELIVTADVTLRDEWCEDVDEKTGYDTKSILSVPIYEERAGAFGCLQALNKQVGDFNEEDIELAKIVAKILADWFVENDLCNFYQNL